VGARGSASGISGRAEAPSCLTRRDRVSRTKFFFAARPIYRLFFFVGALDQNNCACRPVPCKFLRVGLVLLPGFVRFFRFGESGATSTTTLDYSV
jgi:hypothetical protein